MSLRLLLLIISIFILLSTSCSQNNEAQLESAKSTDIVPSATAVKSTNTLELSNSKVFSNNNLRLAYTQSNNLYIFDADNQTSEQIDGNIMVDSISASPDQSTLVYSLLGDNHVISALNFLNMETQENTAFDLSIYDLSISPNLTWSPDNQWVVVYFAGLQTQVFILNIESGQQYQFEWSQTSKTKFWWMENNVFLAYVEWFGRNFVDSDLFLFDVVTDERTDIMLSDDSRRSITLDQQSPSQLASLDRELQQKGLTLALPTTTDGTTVFLPEMASVITILKQDPPETLIVEPCETWSITQKPLRSAVLPEAVYETADVALSTDLTLLPDGSILFLEWVSSDCTYFDSNNLTVNLVYVPGERDEPTILASGLDYDPNLDFYLLTYFDIYPYPRSQVFDVSADGNYVVWLKTTEGIDTSSIMLTEIATGNTEVFFQSENDPISNIFG